MITKAVTQILMGNIFFLLQLYLLVLQIRVFISIMDYIKVFLRV